MEPLRKFYSIGSIIIDDIVLPDGTTRMGILGGGAVHAAMGMRVWTDHAGIIASVGSDLPKKSRKELEETFATEGLVWRKTPTARAWQVYESTGHRTEVFRTDFDQFLQSSPLPGELKGGVIQPAGFHIQCATPEPFISWIRASRQLGCDLVLWEPWDLFCRKENQDEFRQLLPLVDIFSPNLTEARNITGYFDVEDVSRALLSYGARTIAIRMGADGSLVADRGGRSHNIPSIPPDELVDVTGAGNAYCGGFLVCLAETGDLQRAGKCGAVSASFALEQYGAIYPLAGLRERAAERFEWIQLLP